MALLLQISLRSEPEIKAAPYKPADGCNRPLLASDGLICAASRDHLSLCQTREFGEMGLELARIKTPRCIETPQCATRMNRLDLARTSGPDHPIGLGEITGRSPVTEGRKLVAALRCLLLSVDPPRRPPNDACHGPAAPSVLERASQEAFD